MLYYHARVSVCRLFIAHHHFACHGARSMQPMTGRSHGCDSTVPVQRQGFGFHSSTWKGYCVFNMVGSLLWLESPSDRQSDQAIDRATSQVVVYRGSCRHLASASNVRQVSVPTNGEPHAGFVWCARDLGSTLASTCSYLLMRW